MTSRPTLIHLTSFDRAEAGSFVPMLVGVLTAARDRGWGAEAILFESARKADWLEDFAIAGIPVTLAPESTRRSRLRRYRWLRPQLASRPGTKVLHSHFTEWDIPSLLAARGRSDTSVYWHVHSVLAGTAGSIARGSLKFGLVGRGVNGVFCPATNIVDAVVRRRANPDRVHFLPSAIDLTRFPRADPESRLAAREELGLPPDATVLLHFGWDFKVKGGDYFVETIAKLVAAGRTGIIGVSRGGGAETTALARSLGVEDQVRLQPAVEDARTLFEAADLMVSSSREEGMAYSVLEALSSGVPVVATRTAGHEYLAAKMDALRVVGTDAAQLAGEIETTLDRDPAQADRESGQARDWIRDNLDIAAVAGDLLDRYETDLKNAASGSRLRIGQHG